MQNIHPLNINDIKDIKKISALVKLDEKVFSIFYIKDSNDELENSMFSFKKTSDASYWLNSIMNHFKNEFIFTDTHGFKKEVLNPTYKKEKINKTTYITVSIKNSSFDLCFSNEQELTTFLNEFNNR